MSVPPGGGGEPGSCQDTWCGSVTRVRDRRTQTEREDADRPPGGARSRPVPRMRRQNPQHVDSYYRSMRKGPREKRTEEREEGTPRGRNTHGQHACKHTRRREYRGTQVRRLPWGCLGWAVTARGTGRATTRGPKSPLDDGHFCPRWAKLGCSGASPLTEWGPGEREGCVCGARAVWSGEETDQQVAGDVRSREMASPATAVGRCPRRQSQALGRGRRPRGARGH